MKPCAVAALLACHLTALVSPGQAQWVMSAGLRTPRFTGGAEEVATGRSLRPYRPTLFEVGISRQQGRVGVGLRLSYASSSLALEGSDGLAAVKDALSFYDIQPELTLQLAHAGRDGRLHLYGAPLVEIWRLPDAGSRTRIGLALGAGLEITFGDKWSGVLRAGGAVTPRSPFTQEDLDPALEPRTLWRREVSGALQFGL